MAKLDNELTERMKRWLAMPPQQRNLEEGALMVLSLNRNRAMYNTIMRAPERYADRLEYELNKFLRIRLDNMTVAEVASMEREVIPRAADTIKYGEIVVSADDEIPTGKRPMGRRTDHDSLPQYIRELWDNNDTNYRQMVLLFNELKAMHDAQPCDRYDKLKLLDAVERRYRKNLEIYDSYKPGKPDQEPAPALNEAEGPAIMSPEVAAARKRLSKTIQLLEKAAPDYPRREELSERCTADAAVILSSGGEITGRIRARMRAIGVRLPDE